MTSTELVPTSTEPTELDSDRRRRQLAELNLAIERAQTPEEAHRLMLYARTASELFARMKLSLDEKWAAGKAATVAARKLGRFLAELSNRQRGRGTGLGTFPSERTQVARRLGIDATTTRSLVRLAEVPDPDFQRYIQDRSRVPSLNGALTRCTHRALSGKPGGSSAWQTKRRRRVGVQEPANPSIDEGYSLIVRALGHLSAATQQGTIVKRRDLGKAIDYLYAAEDLVKPYRAGYDGTGRKAA